MKELTNSEYLNTFADALDTAERENGVIKMSDELAKVVAERLREIAKEL